jgi:large subunit ribosomal protein L15
MQIHEIKRAHAHKKAKLVARGGKRGKTAGKGGKGQTARAGHRVRPAMRDIIKKLPKLRGHGKNRSESVFYRGPEVVVNLSQLAGFAKGEEVSPKTLLAKGVVKEVVGKTPKIKILGTGDVSHALTFSGCLVSASALSKIEKAGGSVVVTEKPKTQSEEQLKKIALRKEAKANKASNKGAKKGKK